MTWLAPLLLWAPTLFEQSVVRVLERSFPSSQWLLMDAASGEVLGMRWPNANRPIPFGSLVKPFTASSAAGVAPRLRCVPEDCWLPAGHGDLDLQSAIAYSCNSYFLQFASTLPREQVRLSVSRYGLAPPEKFDAETLTGIGWGWPVSPLQMARAYAKLSRSSEANSMRAAMQVAARHGTARAIGSEALAKTGTAPCTHAQKAPGDGYVALMYPAQSPRYVLLAQVHGVTGSVAAATAAEMLSVIRNGK